MMRTMRLFLPTTGWRDEAPGKGQIGWRGRGRYFDQAWFGIKTFPIAIPEFVKMLC